MTSFYCDRMFYMFVLVPDGLSCMENAKMKSINHHLAKCLLVTFLQTNLSEFCRCCFVKKKRD